MAEMIDSYVSMLMFSEDGTKVVLLTKEKPKFLSGKLCPVGGRVEPGEATLAAAIREFFEEAGVETSEADWLRFAVCEGNDWSMSCYVAFSDAAFQCRTMTSEPISIHDVGALLAEVAGNPDLGAPDLIALIGLAAQQRRRRVVAYLPYV